MTDWLISKLVQDGKRRRLEPLGIISAKHQPEALLKAFKKWPDQLDASQVNAGLAARLIEA